MAEILNIMKDVKFDSKGLIPVITQDSETGEVLMMAWMNEEALKRTVRTGTVYYYSRSRAKLWLKGETSGHYQKVVSMHVDCDGDTLLLKVNQTGAACHTGHYSCFYRQLDNDAFKVTSEVVAKPSIPEEKNESGDKNKAGYTTKSEAIMQQVYDVVAGRKKTPKEGSYTNFLFDKGLDKICKKVVEEAAEVIIAAKNDGTDEVKYEIADLMYHLFVLMVEKGVTIEDINKQLEERR